MAYSQLQIQVVVHPREVIQSRWKDFGIITTHILTWYSNLILWDPIAFWEYFIRESEGEGVSSEEINYEKPWWLQKPG